MSKSQLANALSRVKAIKAFRCELGIECVKDICLTLPSQAVYMLLCHFTAAERSVRWIDEFSFSPKIKARFNCIRDSYRDGFVCNPITS